MSYFQQGGSNLIYVSSFPTMLAIYKWLPHVGVRFIWFVGRWVQGEMDINRNILKSFSYRDEIIGYRETVPVFFQRHNTM